MFDYLFLFFAYTYMYMYLILCICIFIIVSRLVYWGTTVPRPDSRLKLPESYI